MNDLLQETHNLIQAIQDGKLDTRGKAERFVGEWRELVVGMNDVINAFVRPITMAATVIDRIAKGDIPDKITEEYKGNFNEIKQNLNILIDSTNEVTRLAEEMAAGNLTIEVNERSDQDTLMQALNAMITKLQDVVVSVKSAADYVASGSREMRTSAEETSGGASRQAAAAEEASTSMEEMAANIRQNADNAQQTEKIALQSAEYAEESGRVVAEAVVAMKKIAKKIAIIQEIADQTRMLSLNATIEAARAHEHGKAFSVVASEVRKLSDVTKKAAEEISELATSSFDVSEKAGKMLTTLVPSIHKTAELVQEISAASSEQSTGAEQINKAIQQLDQVTQQNVVVSENVASAAEELASQAEQLKQTMVFFRIDETPQKIMRHGEKTIKEIQTESPSETNIKAEEKNSRKDTDLDKTDAVDIVSAEYDITVDKADESEDDRDAEFERY